MPPGLENSVDIPEPIFGVVELLDDHIGRYEIERAFGEWLPRDFATHASRHRGMMLQRLRIIIAADDQPAPLDQFGKR